MQSEKQSSKSFSKTSIVFIGSGPVAASSLQKLHDSFAVEAVITKPTTLKEMQSVAKSSSVETVQTKEELDLLIEQKKYSSDVAILIDFGIIVSQKTIDNFPKGIINSHFSLLPELRGADPISFAILEGKKTTGVSLMLLVPTMDEGPLLAQAALEVDHDTTPTLTEKLIELSASMLDLIVPKWLASEVDAMPQDTETIPATYTRKLTKADGIINWEKPAIIIEREIRAYTGWPKSRTTFSGIDCVITSAAVLSLQGKTGKPFIHDKKLAVYCSEDALQIELLKPAGKKEMTSQAFLAGYKSRIIF